MQITATYIFDIKIFSTLIILDLTILSIKLLIIWVIVNYATTQTEPWRATTTHNEPQPPLNLLTARSLMKIVLMLAAQVHSSTCSCLPAPGTHTMFTHHSVCGGSIWKQFSACNITDLAVKRLKSKICCKIYSVFIFSFSSLENLDRRQRQSFSYSSVTF